MSLWKIAWRSIQQRALASSLTGISMALGVMLVVAVLVIHGVINQSFLNNSGLGYNMVVGAKGGRLDLVLNTVYYLARPVENIPYTLLPGIHRGQVQAATSTRRFRSAWATCTRTFASSAPRRHFSTTWTMAARSTNSPRAGTSSRTNIYGAVIGATVARETGLKVGDHVSAVARRRARRARARSVHGAGRAQAHRHAQRSRACSSTWKAST